MSPRMESIFIPYYFSYNNNNPNDQRKRERPIRVFLHAVNRSSPLFEKVFLVMLFRLDLMAFRNLYLGSLFHRLKLERLWDHACLAPLLRLF